MSVLKPLPHHSMEELHGLLQRELGLKTLKAIGGRATGGCINNGQSYHTDKGSIFVKSHDSHKVSEINVPDHMRVYGLTTSTALV